MYLEDTIVMFTEFTFFKCKIVYSEWQFVVEGDYDNTFGAFLFIYQSNLY